MNREVLYINRKKGMNLDLLLDYTLRSVEKYYRLYSKFPKAIRFKIDDYYDILKNRNNVLLREENKTYILGIKVEI